MVCSPFGWDKVSFKSCVVMRDLLHPIKSGTNIIVGIASVVVVGIAIVVAIAEISGRSYQTSPTVFILRLSPAFQEINLFLDAFQNRNIFIQICCK